MKFIEHKGRDYRRIFWLVFLTWLLCTLSGCETDNLKPAPVGDHAVLEQLADAYRTVANEFPVQPAGMPPAGKKQYVERVFFVAGYSYTATLKLMAKQGGDVISQEHRDLAELLFLPHHGLADADMVKLYSADEIAAIKSIQAKLK